MLYPHRDELHERESVFGIIDTVRGPRWTFLSNLHVYIPCCFAQRKAILLGGKSEVQVGCPPIRDLRPDKLVRQVESPCRPIGPALIQKILGQLSDLQRHPQK